MTKKIATEPAGTPSAETKAGTKPARAGKSTRGETKPRSKTKSKADKALHEGFDFIGKVESLVVKGTSRAEVFEFGLRGRHGSRQTFRLKTSDSFSLTVIAPIVMAAHASEAKIGVRAMADEGGIAYVTEVASRPKLGKAS